MNPPTFRLFLAALSVALLTVLTTAAPVMAQCVEGDCVNGKGTKLTRGHIYQGEFKDNHRQGYGIYTFPDGSVYRGQFVKGAMEGEGEYSFQSGDVYKGTFKNNKRNGQGSYYRADGTVLSGLWEDNVLVMEGEGLVTTGLDLDQGDLEQPTDLEQPAVPEDGNPAMQAVDNGQADEAMAGESAGQPADEAADELEKELELMDDSAADPATESESGTF